MLELMVTIAIAALLVVIGVPSFNQIMINARTAAVANDVTSAINLARAEAVRRSQQVTVCPSDDAANCSGVWTDGWIAMSAAGAVLRAWGAPDSRSVIGQVPNANEAIVFGPLGERVSVETTLLIQVAGCSGNRARRLRLGAAGRVSVERVDCT